MRTIIPLALFFVSHCLCAQKKTEDLEVAYYYDLNSGNSLIVNDVHQPELNIQYTDRYGMEKELLLSLFNWKNEVVAQFSLAKTLGVNHFKIGIESIFETWKEGEVYSCRMRDEMGGKYELSLRKTVNKNEAPSVSLFANPLRISCNEPGGNVVDFYANISGGKAPYTITWYILNESRSDFLYQPREEVIERPGNTMVVNVDKDPNYYVMVLVTDGCKSEARQMIHLTCSGKEKKVHTVFVEPIKHLPSRSFPTN